MRVQMTMVEFCFRNCLHFIAPEWIKQQCKKRQREEAEESVKSDQALETVIVISKDRKSE
jgi:hypothetical protein